MNQEAKTTKKPKTKNKIQIRDLTPKKDPKGGCRKAGGDRG